MASKPRAGRIDTSTGQNKRVKVTMEPEQGGPKGKLRPQRWNGRIVRGGRLAFARARATRADSARVDGGHW